MAPTYKTFGEWLKGERERKNLTQSELARRAGVKPQYIWNLENAVPTKSGTDPKPSPDVCTRIARALGVHYLESLRAAGYVPDDIPESEIVAKMAGDYVISLPEEKQDEALSHLKFLFEKYGDVGKMRERSPKHPAVVKDDEDSPKPLAETTPQQKGKMKGSKKSAGKSAHAKRAAKNGSDKGR